MDAVNPMQKIETREDEEQSKKYFETIELLLAAGYFRARIKGLSPFDKVVGGMTWCILTCEFDVDVDLLFQENSTIGQKIALTEKIVAVLPRMKCPHRIEPHQIQGLDFIHIFPVIQWLVKRAIETREVLGDKIRAYSISQFNKKYHLPLDDQMKAKHPRSVEAINTCKVLLPAFAIPEMESERKEKPKRIYKKPLSLRESEEEIQVQSTLLEYGRRYGVTRGLANEKETTAQQKALSAGLIKADENNEFDDSEEKRINQLMEGMSETDIREVLSSKAVGSIVGLRSSEISQTIQDYIEQKKLLEQETEELKQGGKLTTGLQSHQRQVAMIKKAIEEETEKVQKAEEDLRDSSSNLDVAKSTYSELKLYSEKLEEEQQKLEENETNETNNTLEKLRALVALNENLKEQEKEFKLQCKVEFKEIESKIEALESEASVENNAEMERVQIINEQYDKDNEKFGKIRLLLAKRTREIASLQWKIDDVPSRAELSQYQRRFVELYNQVASTHTETKQYYTLYNTLDDTKLYLEKEVGYLNSIQDGFEQASTQSPSSKEEFLKQLEKIVQGVKMNKEKVDKKKSQEKSKRDLLNMQLMEVVEKQRQYYKSVRDFQEECKKNEVIQSKLRTAGIEV